MTDFLLLSRRRVSLLLSGPVKRLISLHVYRDTCIYTCPCMRGVCTCLYVFLRRCIRVFTCTYFLVHECIDFETCMWQPSQAERSRAVGSFSHPPLETASARRERTYGYGPNSSWGRDLEPGVCTQLAHSRAELWEVSQNIRERPCAGFIHRASLGDARSQGIILSSFILSLEQDYRN